MHEGLHWILDVAGANPVCAAQAGHSSAVEHRKCLSPPRRWRNFRVQIQVLKFVERMRSGLHFKHEELQVRILLAHGRKLYRHSGTGKRACLNIFVVRQF